MYWLTLSDKPSMTPHMSQKTRSQIVIKSYKIADVKPAAYNPRDIGDAAFEGLKESLKKFGMVDPLVVNIRPSPTVLVGGHQRLKAAEAIGLTHVPVVEVDLSPAEEKALNVTLNNQKISGFYTETLNELIEEIRAELGDETLAALRLDDIVIPSGWETDMDAVLDADENLDGISTVIKVKCPQAIRDDVLVILKRAIIETSLEGVEIV